LTQGGYLGNIAGNIETTEIWLALLVIPFIFFNAYIERIIRSYHLFRAINIRTVIGAVATLVFYLIFFFFYKIQLREALIGTILGQFVQLIMNFYFLIFIINVKWTTSFKLAFKPFRYGIQNWINQILSSSNDKIDQIILTFLLSASSFGIYVVGVSLSNIIGNMPSSYINVFYNQITERREEESIELYARAQRITFIITILITVSLVILAYPLIYLIYGSAFTDAAWVVALYAPGLVFQVAARLSIKFYAGRGKPLKNSLVYLAGIIISLPFYFWLVPKYGIYGAAISSSIAYLSAFCFSFYQINKEFRVPLKAILLFRKEDKQYILMQLAKIPRIGKYFVR
ncbi:MAG: polysaccharide biosynthesis C-terminal domain-containing protein, partial [Bdellovibrionales bacterium]|nr:polysaccharide biosynthesis C-terminal domain-containing protein [Bdellovibrionales bacterium]